MRKLVFAADDLHRCLVRNEAETLKLIGAYKKAGFEIVLSAPGTIPVSGRSTLDGSLRQLESLAVICDSVEFGGPDPELRGLHLDDKAITPDEFLTLTYDELRELVTPL